ncbi:MAG: hypothetical protein ACNS63_10675 [Candidatus Nitrospinota bacterium M3_3B_026]
MMRSFLREAFRDGAAPFYVLGAAPFALLVSFAFPYAFSPFILAASLFPPFFYYVRREEYSKTFWIMILWAAVHFSLTGVLTGMAPDFMAGRLHAAPAVSSAFAGDPAPLAGQRLVELLITVVLSGLSGGAFALVAWADAAGGAGVRAGGFLAGEGSGWTAFFLSLAPWEAACHVGRAMAAISAAAVFYMKLERRPVKLDYPVRYLALALAFTALGVYLELRLAPAWMEALAAAAP